MNFFKHLFAIVALMASLNSAAETITLAVENSWPPFADKDGNGISKEIIQAAYSSVNMRVEFIAVPYARALIMAEQGQVDGAFNVTKQKSTLEKFYFGEVPILKTSASFYYHIDSAMNFTSNNEILKDTSVGVIIGYEYGDNYEKNKHRFKEVKVANQAQLFQLLKKKRIDVAIMFDEVVKSKLDNMQLDFDDIRKGSINHESYIHVAFSQAKDTAKAMRLLDKGLRNIKQ